jgi:organic hydroperoxide reductase OsmC/OhrA
MHVGLPEAWEFERMPCTTVELRNINDTQAALGWADAHSLVVDRPEGRAGGMGLGFNGAQLLALAIGGCFCNDLRYVAEKIGAALGAIRITVTVELEGDPLFTTMANMVVSCEMLDGSDPRQLIEQAKAITMVSNSLRQGFPVNIQEP